MIKTEAAEEDQDQGRKDQEADLETDTGVLETGIEEVDPETEEVNPEIDEEDPDLGNIEIKDTILQSQLFLQISHKRFGLQRHIAVFRSLETKQGCLGSIKEMSP